MERVGILINKLQEQLEQGADPKNMLVTVQMLNTELVQSVQQKNGSPASKVSVVMPYNYTTPVVEGEMFAANTGTASVQPLAQNEAVANDIAVAEQLPVDLVAIDTPEDAVNVKAEIKREHTSWIFDPIEAPTLAHQERIVYELNDSMISGEASLNDKLKTEEPEVAHVLHEVPIRDLKKAISINDRHRFIEDLFRGDETMYERSIKTINNFNNFAEAEFWMQRELKLKLAWDNTSAQVKLFDQLVRRRFA